MLLRLLFSTKAIERFIYKANHNVATKTDTSAHLVRVKQVIPILNKRNKPRTGTKSSRKKGNERVILRFMGNYISHANTIFTSFADYNLLFLGYDGVKMLMSLMSL